MQGTLMEILAKLTISVMTLGVCVFYGGLLFDRDRVTRAGAWVAAAGVVAALVWLLTTMWTGAPQCAF